eukprot:5717623-Pleurochrysis_carterae.AAC.1
MRRADHAHYTATHSLARPRTAQRGGAVRSAFWVPRAAACDDGVAGLVRGYRAYPHSTNGRGQSHGCAVRSCAVQKVGLDRTTKRDLKAR